MQEQIEIHFEYPQMDMVMRIIKRQQIQIISQQLELNCVLIISVAKSKTEDTIARFLEIRNIKVEKCMP